MSRQSGYNVTIKAFIPSPKDDFEKQAAAATAMGIMTKTKALPDNFAELATIVEIKGKFGSLAEDETPAPDEPEPAAASGKKGNNIVHPDTGE